MRWLENSLYDDSYFKSRIDPRRDTAYRQDAKAIYRRTSPKNVLDYGCGTGEFKKYLSGNYFGYDPFTRPDVELPDTLFDLIIFRGTLQHIYNPIEVLLYTFEHLSENGLVAILATPDTDSLGYMRWGTLPALDPYRNWIPFGHRMLDNVLRRLGFSGIEFEWPYRKPYANPARNLWNFLSGKPDAFPGNMMNCFAVKE